MFFIQYCHRLTVGGRKRQSNGIYLQFMGFCAKSATICREIYGGKARRLPPKPSHHVPALITCHDTSFMKKKRKKKEKKNEQADKFFWLMRNQWLGLHVDQGIIASAGDISE